MQQPQHAALRACYNTRRCNTRRYARGVTRAFGGSSSSSSSSPNTRRYARATTRGVTTRGVTHAALRAHVVQSSSWRSWEGILCLAAVDHSD
jgi:hypothetical protein